MSGASHSFRSVDPGCEGPSLGASAKMLGSWQLRAIALITLLGPAAASVILLAVDDLEYLRTIPFNVGDFLVVLFFVAVPVGYALGAVPALLAASLYCALLTAGQTLLRRLRLIRVCVGAICGGLASWLWFCKWLSASNIYGLVGALVMAALSFRNPQPTARRVQSGKQVRGRRCRIPSIPAPGAAQ